MIQILYVDDEPDLREVASMALELDGEIEVRDCGSGGEALDILDSWTPDLVLLDVMMPEMDGPATYAAIRDRKMDLPIVFITARAQDADLQRLLALGAAGVISKPFDPMTLADQVRACMASA
jgi:CheY-like chemotaxis protein